MKIYSKIFRWKKTQGENIKAQLFLGDFHADGEVMTRNHNFWVF